MVNALSKPLAISQYFERTPVRSRLTSADMVIVFIVLGLASRKFAWLLPELIQTNIGDVLWAAMVFFIFAFLLPRLSTLQLAAVAFIFSCCIEVSKLFHASWFETLRATEIGRLIFGYVFGWSNVVCYFVGIVLGAVVDTAFRTKHLRYSKRAE